MIRGWAGRAMAVALAAAALLPRSAWTEEPAPGAVAAAAPQAQIPFVLARDAAAYTREAAARERTALWAWSTVAVGSSVYTGLVLAGRRPGPDWVGSLAVVGTVGGVIGGLRSWWRARELTALGARLDPTAAGGEWAAGTALDLETRLAFERELFGERRRLAVSARGALRAGIVLPVLLGGIAVYGLLAGSGGDELAGISLGGALVIGAPSVLTYWGLQERLRRVDALARSWTEAHAGPGRTVGEP